MPTPQDESDHAPHVLEPRPARPPRSPARPPGDFGPFHRTIPMHPGELGSMKRTFDERFPPLSPEREQDAIEKWTRKTSTPKRPSVPKQVRPCTYLVGAEGSPLVKIGYTGGDPKARLASLQTGQPMTLSLLWSVDSNYEKWLHDRFAEYRVRGEWFDLTPLGDPVTVVKDAVASGFGRTEHDDLTPRPNMPVGLREENWHHWLNARIREKFYSRSFTFAEAAEAHNLPLEFVEKYGSRLAESGSLVVQRVSRNGQKVYQTRWDEGDRWALLGPRQQ